MEIKQHKNYNDKLYLITTTKTTFTQKERKKKHVNIKKTHKQITNFSMQICCPEITLCSHLAKHTYLPYWYNHNTDHDLRCAEQTTGHTRAAFFIS